MTETVGELVIPKKKKRFMSPEEDKGDEKTVGRLRSSTDEESEKLTENILSTLSQRMLRNYFDIQNIQIVENSLLTEKFQKMQNYIRGTTYRTETLGFILIGSNDEELSKIISSGLSVGYSLFSDLGNSKQGVTVYRYVDQVTPAPFFPGMKLRIICFKTLRGKSKDVDLSSATLCPSPIYNSHIVRSTNDPWQNLTFLKKFRTSAVYHFEFDANGQTVKTPSGVLPYAVFDLVPTYGDTQLPSYATRLRPSHKLTMNASVVPSDGIFAGSLCKLSTIRGDEAIPSIPHFNLLHVPNKFYKWKALLKMKLFANLMKPGNWCKLLNGQEFEIKVHDHAKAFISYWVFNSITKSPNGTEAQQLFTRMESKRLGLIGNCEDSTLFLFPNGQLPSVLGLPCLDKSSLHCVAVNAKLSTFRRLPQHVQVNRFESNMATAYTDDVANNVSIPKHRLIKFCLRVLSPPSLEHTLEITPLVECGSEDDLIAKDRAETSNGFKYQLNTASELNPYTFHKDEYTFSNPVENDKTGAVPSVSSVTGKKADDTPHLCSPSNHTMACEDVEMNSPDGYEHLYPSDGDYELFFESEDAFFAGECSVREQVLTAKGCIQEGGICENNSFITTTPSTSGESLLGQSIPAVGHSEGELLNSTLRHETVADVIDLDEYEAKTYYEEDPIMKGVMSYIMTPAPPKIYNGSLKLRYYPVGSKRRHLLPTPSTNKAVLNLSRQPAENKVVQAEKKFQFREPLLPLPAPNPLSHIKVAHALCNVMTTDSQVEKSSSRDKPLLVVIDSNIILQGKLKPDELRLMLRRMKLNKLLTKRRHKVMYHRFLEQYMRDGITNPESSIKERECMQEYLLITDLYSRQNILMQMDHHRCDNMLDQDKVHCLRYTIAAARREDKSVEVRYLTDMESCTIGRYFEDPRVKFIGYESWIRIFD